jgi:uncharacterized protein YijF (DUF1287 family)
MIVLTALWLAHGTAERIAAGARAQLSPPAVYDASYQRMSFPNGDVAWGRGACSDVVVRAFRCAGYDLQRLVHEDRKARGLPTDTNIDHRRVRNHAEFFRTHGRVLTNSTDDSLAWKPGDVVYWKLDNGLDHTGVVTWRMGRSGLPMVVHNISQTKEEDVLAKWRIVGHYRYP